MELYLNRTDKRETRTNGDLYCEFVFLMHTLEDAVREVAGKPVSDWKVSGKTAIPSGRYRITLESSPKFGPETITINNVPGFSYIRMHSGNTEEDSEGCPILGYELDGIGRIVPGTTRSAVMNLKRVIKEAMITRNEQVWITIR